jgi:tellurite methyltransferase
VHSDIDRWNARYSRRTARAVIEPDPLLLEHRAMLGTAGLGVDIAGGTGDNGLYLNQLGYDSVIVDGSEVGLRQCRRKAQANGLSPMLVAADLDRFALPASTFDVVLVFRYLNRNLVDAILRCLKPNGVLFFKSFNKHHLKAHPQFPPQYVLRDGELSDCFADLRCAATNDRQFTSDTTYYWVGIGTGREAS